MAESQNSKLEGAKHNYSDQNDVEIVDLAEGVSPLQYSKLGPRNYRKLHNLHTRFQKSNTLARLPKQKPQFSYASGNEPDLPFLRQSKAADDDYIVGSEASDEDFPSPSAIPLVQHLQKGDVDPFEFGNVNYENAMQTSASLDDSLESLEAGMLGIDEPMPLRPPTPNVNTSFAEGFFDFDAFEENYGDPEPYSSPLMSITRKRERSSTPPLSESKYRRVSQDAETSSGINSSIKAESSALIERESSTTSDIPLVESRRIKIQDVIEDPPPRVEETTLQQSVPAWVNEFDADLIQSLMSSVDFVE